MSTKMIPKYIYLIWLGDNLPIYISNVIQLYKKLNSKFTVIFIHFTINNIYNIYLNTYTVQYSTQLKKSINYILNIENKYKNFILEQKQIYGKNIRAIQILSDIFRLELINTYGGIYVDCDTVPLKPFDNALLANNKFIVTRHYDTGFLYKTNTKYIDNYFIGSNGQSNGQITNLTDDKTLIQILQTDKNWYKNIFYQYRKKQFYNNTLDIKTLIQLNSNFYIEHYHDNNWKRNVYNKIRTEKCFLDNFL